MSVAHTARTPLVEKAVAGLHDFVASQVLPRYAHHGGRAMDLGAGSGALALRLRAMGLDVRAADLNSSSYKADVPFEQIDLNQPEFSAQLGAGQYDLVTSFEVIEHVENPIGFLRNVGLLLKPGGAAIVTTPNVDNAPARVKFFLTGKVRMMDEMGDPTHISPIFWSLIERQLPRAGLNLVEHHVFPPRSYLCTRPQFTWAFRMLAALLPGESVLGDNHILVLQVKK